MSNLGAAVGIVYKLHLLSLIIALITGTLEAEYLEFLYLLLCKNHFTFTKFTSTEGLFDVTLLEDNFSFKTILAINSDPNIT